MVVVQASDTLNREQLVTFANKELIDRKVIARDYFAIKNKEETPLSTSPYLQGIRDYIVYGNPHGDMKQGVYRYVGYTYEGDAFTNYAFPSDVTAPTGLWDRNWIRTPWKDPATKNRVELNKTVKDGIQFQSKALFETSIRFGLQMISRKKPDGSLLDFPTDKIQLRNWHEYAHIYQPPTSVSWGAGIMFHKTDNGTVYYVTVPLSPEGMKSDLDVQFRDLPSSAVVGEEVVVSVRVVSTFSNAVARVPYQWNITTKNGNGIPVTFEGHATTAVGTVAVPASGERLLYASFVMPSQDVRVRFVLNEQEQTPRENNFSNNRLDSGNAIRAVAAQSFVGNLDELDYPVLSRKLKFKLSPSALIANLILPQGSWKSWATGSLGVSNQTPSLFRQFTVEDNPTVNEATTTITRDPSINTTVYRADIGDDPQNQGFASNGSVTKTGSITYSGTVSRGYTYQEQYCYYETRYYTIERMGSIPQYAQSNQMQVPYQAYVCNTVTNDRTTSASFPSGTQSKTVRAWVYHGKTMDPKTWDLKITGNTEKNLVRSMLWPSRSYPINVIRWMYHLDDQGQAYGATSVDGRVDRHFTQQSSARIEWEVVRTMEQLYEQSREAARDKNDDTNQYDRAVFASDREREDEAYPIRSGYYFNPAGEYTCTVETVTFKPTNADTEEHRRLVQAIVDAFRYKTNLIYINRQQKAVDIQNNPLAKNDNRYVPRIAALTNADRTAVDDASMLTVTNQHTKTTQLLQSATDQNGSTHRYWKQILEGYAESNTLDSQTQYRYREFVKPGQPMYEITETTTITIRINPNNQKVYTHESMSDGTYTITVSVDDIDLSTLTTTEFTGLGRLEGIKELDQIEVTVDGSIYEDAQ